MIKTGASRFLFWYTIRMSQGSLYQKVIMHCAAAVFILVCVVGADFLLAPHVVHAETTVEREARLRQELANVEREVKETEAALASAKNESASLDRDIRILNGQIKSAQLKIQAKNLVIATLGKDISSKNAHIGELNERIQRGQESLAELLRKRNEFDTYSLPEVVLSRVSLTQFFADIDDFEMIEDSLAATFADIRNARSQTETEKQALDKKKNQEIDARAVIADEKKKIESAEAEKKRLLTLSKNSEQLYSKIAAEKRTKAASIRAALFSLRDSEAIPFEKALAYANEAAKSTGIRPAFLLAIMMQESAFGKNVGSCYLTDPDTGAGASIRSGNKFPNVMKPGRDVEPFIEITKALGLDPFKTLISCPQSIGWGGAMGPAQFIASTWKLFEARLKTALGIQAPNPWEPRHAFMASAMYLSDLGARGGSYTGERNAACRYYSGRACTVGHINMTYGDQVMIKAANIQLTMINPLEGF